MTSVTSIRRPVGTVMVIIAAYGCNSSPPLGGGDPQPARPSSALIDSKGGALAAGSGLTLTIPPNALQTPTSVSVRDVQSETLPAETLTAIESLSMVQILAFELDTGGVGLQRAADLMIPNVMNIPPGQALVVQIVPDVPGSSAVLVETANVTASQIETASEPFPGIRGPGTFVVAVPVPDAGATPFLFAHGIVHDAASLPVSNGLVQSMASPIPSLTAPDGSYVAHTGLYVSDLPLPLTILAQNAGGSQFGAITPRVDGPPSIDPPIVEVETIVLVQVEAIRIERVRRACIECDQELKAQIQRVVDTLKDINTQTGPLFDPLPLTVEACGDSKTFNSVLIKIEPVIAGEGAELGDLTACGEVPLKLAKVEFRPLEVVVGTVGVEDGEVASISGSTKRMDNEHVQAQLTITGSREGQTSATLDVAVVSFGYKQYIQIPVLQLPIFCPGGGTVEHVVKPSKKLKLVEDKDIPVIVQRASADADGNRLVFSNPVPTGTIDDCHPTISVDVETPCNPTGLLEGSIEFLQLDNEPVDFRLTTLTEGLGLRVWYQPTEGLERGTHKVALSAGPSGAGQRELFSWDFEIQDCQGTLSGMWTLLPSGVLDECNVSFSSVEGFPPQYCPGTSERQCTEWAGFRDNPQCSNVPCPWPVLGDEALFVCQNGNELRAVPAPPGVGNWTGRPCLLIRPFMVCGICGEMESFEAQTTLSGSPGPNGDTVSVSLALSDVRPLGSTAATLLFTGTVVRLAQPIDVEPPCCFLSDSATFAIEGEFDFTIECTVFPCDPYVRIIERGKSATITIVPTKELAAHGIVLRCDD